MEVPDFVVVSSLLKSLQRALKMPTPGAKISTQGPKFEKEARTSFFFVAPTVIVCIAGENEIYGNGVVKRLETHSEAHSKQFLVRIDPDRVTWV